MRNYQEFTASRLLCEPLVFGLPIPIVIFMLAVCLTLEIAAGSAKNASLFILGGTLASLVGLRVIHHYAKPGWFESYVFWLEKVLSKKSALGFTTPRISDEEVFHFSTLDERELISKKAFLAEKLRKLKASESCAYLLTMSKRGAWMSCYDLTEQGSTSKELLSVLSKSFHTYTLTNLPMTTDPLFLTHMLKEVSGDYQVLVNIKGLNPGKIKQRIELARKRNSIEEDLKIDSKVSFEQASHVLEEITRGAESVVELTLVVLTAQKTDLDERFFTLEPASKKDLIFSSVTGTRRRSHFSHIVRSVTASDFVPQFSEPYEETSIPLLKSSEGKPIYFNPVDKRLEALHWIVAGATGSGKSFFTALVLNRLRESGFKFSALFIDDKQGFKRFVTNANAGKYITTDSPEELQAALPTVFSESPFISGIELSKFKDTKKIEALRTILNALEKFLEQRESSFPVYIVFDETWTYLREDPLPIQNAVRTFRKLNGAVISITQSLGDFLTHELGQSIFQNTPIRILLRHGEDLARYQGNLGLNEVELRIVRFLSQSKGNFGECLIKTPFLSRFGRLEPSASEHELFRSDNLREEALRETKAQRATV